MKNLKMLAFAILVSLSIVSCSKDDDNEPTTQELLSGKWEFVENGRIDDTGAETLYDWEGGCSDNNDFIQFSEGNVLTEGYYYGCDDYDDYSGTWSLNNKTITVADSYEFADGNLEIIELTDSKLKIKFPYGNDRKIKNFKVSSTKTTNYVSVVYVFRKATN